MKPLPDYSKLWFSIVYCILIIESVLTAGTFKIDIANKNFAWMSPRGQVFREPAKEIYCTMDWAILVAAKATNTSTNLAFIEDEYTLMNYPKVLSVNSTTISLCVDENKLSHGYECTLIVSKIPRTGQVQDFDSQFNLKCKEEFARNDTYLKNFVQQGPDASSACSEGLQRIKSNGFLHLLNNLTLVSKKSSNEYELVEIKVDSVFVRVPSQSNLKCNPKNHKYAIPPELINWKISSEILQTLLLPGEVTSSSITRRYSSTRYLMQFTNWTCELNYTSEEGSEHSLPCPTLKLTDKAGVLFNLTNLESNMKYSFIFRIKSIYESRTCTSPKFGVTYLTNPQTPDTGVGLFQLGPPRLDNRNVTIYWRPMKFYQHNINVSYDVEIFEINARGQLMTSHDLHRYSNSLTKWRIKYTIGPSAYRFFIKSTNSQIDSQQSSIDVPPKTDKVNSNICLYSINYENNTVEYIWQLPKKQPDIVNFTYFWYWTDQNATSRKINNLTMNWTYLPANATRHRVKFDYNIRNKSFHSFISINTRRSSSGLLAPINTIYSISSRVLKSVKPSALSQNVVSTIK